MGKTTVSYPVLLSEFMRLYEFIFYKHGFNVDHHEEQTG